MEVYFHFTIRPVTLCSIKHSIRLHDLSEDVKTTLEWILGKQGGKVWTGVIWHRKGTNGEFL
jgi:hypothetical protein